MKSIVISLLALTLFVSCKKKEPVSSNGISKTLSIAGNNREELVKALHYYQAPKDSLKKKAMEFLVENMAGQYHYEGRGIEKYRNVFHRFDSLNALDQHEIRSLWTLFKDTLNVPGPSTVTCVPDARTITAAYLVRNVEGAFKAWSYPWARKLSFEEFCEYLLPYKVQNEQYSDWRETLQEKYKWVLDSVKNTGDSREACLLINRDLKHWFHITIFTTYWDLSLNDLMTFKGGRCEEATGLTAYAMRAMGIPVAIDLCSWANRSMGHQWNVVLLNGKWVPFVGTESDPGMTKTQFNQWRLILRKSAKTYRRTYRLQEKISPPNRSERVAPFSVNRHLADVTREYVLTTSVNIPFKHAPEGIKYGTLATFNNKDWQPAVSAELDQTGYAGFKDLGRDIVYLPAGYSDGKMLALNLPFILTKSGKVDFIQPDYQHKQSLTLLRKYPEDPTNEIFKGENYELFYWDSEWISLGRQQATTNSLTYKGVPAGALYWLRNLDKGTQERIFTVEKGQQIWW